MPAADLQPHASFVLINVQTGRVLRRLAAKGEQGPVSDGRFLWSFSDTGITRTSLGEPPAIWSNPVRADQDDSLPEESVWTPDRSVFFVRAKPKDTGLLIEVSPGSGAVRRVGDPGNDLRLVRADGKSRVLLAGNAHVNLYDARRGQVIRHVPEELLAVAKDGCIYTCAKYPGGKRELIRYDPSLKPEARLELRGDLTSGCLSADGRVLASSEAGGEGIELRRADTLARMVTLHFGGDGGSYPLALAAGADGWWILAGSDQEFDDAVTHYTRQGQHVRSWDADGRRTILSPDGKSIYIARESDLLVIDTARGATRRIPYSWRRLLPRRYLPPASDPATPTHLEISALTLTPDGRTLILTEWLNGDPDT
jgi:hypothetical protein